MDLPLWQDKPQMPLVMWVEKLKGQSTRQKESATSCVGFDFYHLEISRQLPWILCLFAQNNETDSRIARLNSCLRLILKG
jgi:hypothetical protein